MELILAVALLPATTSSASGGQEKNGNGDLKYEDIKIIAERNIFSPHKPKAVKKDDPPKKADPPPKKEEEKKLPPPPYVTGFALYPDGFRMSVVDPNTQATTRYKAGDKLIGGTIESIDNLRAKVKVGDQTIELRTGDAVKEGAAATSAPTGGPATILAEAVPVEEDPDADETRRKMKERFKKRPIDEEEDDENPRKKKRP
jgi:hypothetical protein